MAAHNCVQRFDCSDRSGVIHGCEVDRIVGKGAYCSSREGDSPSRSNQRRRDDSPRTCWSGGRRRDEWEPQRQPHHRDGVRSWRPRNVLATMKVSYRPELSPEEKHDRKRSSSRRDEYLEDCNSGAQAAESAYDSCTRDQKRMRSLKSPQREFQSQNKGIGQSHLSFSLSLGLVRHTTSHAKAQGQEELESAAANHTSKPLQTLDPNMMREDPCVRTTSEAERKQERTARGSVPPVVKDFTHKFLVEEPVLKQPLQETDKQRLCQRQKQIDYGKNTLGYERYTQLVPKNFRKKNDPCTPEVKKLCSKRAWDGLIKKWRRQLHDFDPPVAEGEEVVHIPEDGDPMLDDAVQTSADKVSPEAEDLPEWTSPTVAARTLFDDWEEI